MTLKASQEITRVLMITYGLTDNLSEKYASHGIGLVSLRASNGKFIMSSDKFCHCIYDYRKLSINQFEKIT